MYKRWGRGPVAHEVLGFLFAAYLRFVRRANRFVQEPADLDEFLARQTPFIVAMWHGQHLMIPYARTKSIARIAALTSRSRDGGPQAVALRHLGIMPVRGSGGKPGQARQKGGAAALLRLKRELDDGATVALTADVQKRPRVAGLGIVTLAKLSGRPIAPTAVVTSRRFDFELLGPGQHRQAVRARRDCRRRLHRRARRRRRGGLGGRAPRGAVGPR